MPVTRQPMRLDLLGLAGAVVVLDQASKALVVHRLRVGERRAPRLGIAVRHIANTRSLLVCTRLSAVVAAWLGLSIALVVLGALAVGPYVYAAQAGLAVVFGGVTGNLLDAITRGAVVDFIDLRIWPVFNLADVAIVTGTAVAALGLAAR